MPAVDDEWEWQRLGESFEFGEVIVEILEKAGWTVTRHRAFADDGFLLVAARPDLDFDVRAAGPTIGAAATELLLEAGRYRRVDAAA